MNLLKELCGTLALSLALVACNAPEKVSAPESASPAGDEGKIEYWNANDWIVKDEKGNRLPEEVLAKRAYDKYPYKWNKSTLTYGFVGAWDSRAKSLVHSAFSGLGSILPLEFQFTSNGAYADFSLTLKTAAEMGSRSGECASTYSGPVNGPFEYTKAEISLAYQGHRMATRDNEFLYVTMHEIGHGLGMKHSSIQTSMMWSPYTVVNGVPRLYFLADDDIQGLQSIYGAATPKYPNWNHRYTILTKTYISSPPPGAPPGAQPIGWVSAGGPYPYWSSIMPRFNEINNESWRLSIVRP